jgi:hypothetical protein
MRARRALGNSDTLAQTIGLMKIGELLRAEYSAAEAPMPEDLAKLLVRLEPSGRSTPRVSSAACPRCNITMLKVVHAPGLGGHPSLGGYACPKCKYIAGGRMSEATYSGKH